MKFIYSLFIIALFCSCQKEPKKILATDYLNRKQIEAFKYDIIRYSDIIVKNATHDTKFGAQFDSIYTIKAKSADLYYYYIDKNSNEIYFAIARIAPSLKVKRVVTAGKLTKDMNGNITFYEEAFRTWKMEIPELKIKSKLLFEKYIQGEDLTEYYTKNSKGEFFIEFPDDINYYDSDLRRWETKK
ncbi:hypothetical protein [Flavobacterium sp.]|jgi:hypothetical protein|uniref:hypothetical protein n=1 Tax=Flavobacterium sp. TaxID=239 RepID=UPI0037C17CE4